MAMFVHLTPEKNARHVTRTGLRTRRSPDPAGRVVFAVPVTASWYMSHQWLRELKRRGQRTLVAVHFRVPDDQPVLVGHYGTAHRAVTAAEAVAIVAAAENAEGYEVLIPRRIEAAEIHAIREVSQVAGWRYKPGAHGSPPCGCPYCQRGLMGARKIRERLGGG